MTPRQIGILLSTRFGDRLTAVLPDDRHPRVQLIADHWREVAEYLRREPALSFDWLCCLSGVDYVADDRMAVVYDLWSSSHRHRFAAKVFMPRSEPIVPSACEQWPAANWHEREAFDLLGIQFEGHPDPRRILCADDWVGHPLRKDYIFPREYHGIPGSVELDWEQKPNYPK